MTTTLLAIIYLAFISLGLPDSLLGSAWPIMYTHFQVPLSYAGIVSMIIALGTVVSSLQSDRLTLEFGAGKVTAVSVAMTAAALFGFSVSDSFLELCIWAVPYGLGAGSVDASLNNYVALHYESSHMSWLHCMWGVGAVTGPYIMGYALSDRQSWQMGYRYISILQVILTGILFMSLPLWKKRNQETGSKNGKKREALHLKDIWKIRGAKEVLILFLCYNAFEQTCGLWASSFLYLNKGVPKDRAASFAALFYMGITAGRAINGFIAMKLKDSQMIRMGQTLILIGILVVTAAGNANVALIGLLLLGSGCAPIYPCVIHSTPEHFGEERSQALIGAQMAFAYTGTLFLPPLFGVIANRISISLLPVYLLVLLLVMIVMHEALNKDAK